MKHQYIDAEMEGAPPKKNPDEKSTFQIGARKISSPPIRGGG
jgi:hypothetical protein